MKNKEIISFYKEMSPLAKALWAGKSVRSYSIAIFLFCIILTLTVNILFIYTGSWKEILNTKSTLLRSDNFGLSILIILIILPNAVTFYRILKSLGLYFKTPRNQYFEQLPNKCL
ncbi:hypothetical protein [Elizabethkingia anophelis]|uniref:Uncharacterized protein n=1 Tax=Elizabethkingia anophelis R26 TaxID=1246994 RepID=A0ABM6MRI5_9FLAO|nr:hypothetical protein [Elizabethkingia anophelis]ATC35576.1 hypothetical protein BAZ09_004825 [Elizabethkingia anophelis R26]ATC39214.1 hypothetical protein EAAG1_004825 [Elizabethkingia anophelis Ag1]ATC42895.1 hypothetical protein CMV41_04825 [Elizabethkingia anophelis]ATC46571.1 hypothetical protein CMV40_04825 [Elizabethkingia anophelis]MCQ0432179.1 hypothetical protein [Elizabethkingia anophelis]